ncbi:MAG: hypothetical protein K2L78_02115, partial [Muribaculaceae bacterium]|nr:hypothetical protein [Muribaculaceae bacterium]
MALFRTLKRAFGFDSSDYDDDEPEGIDARVTPLRKRGDENPGPADEVSMRHDATDDAADEANSDDASVAADRASGKDTV